MSRFCLFPFINTQEREQGNPELGFSQDTKTGGTRVSLGSHSEEQQQQLSDAPRQTFP